MPEIVDPGTNRSDRPIRCARRRSVKYEDIYLRAYENGRELQAGLIRYFDFYNRRRIHQSVTNPTLTRHYPIIILSL